MNRDSQDGAWKVHPTVRTCSTCSTLHLDHNWPTGCFLPPTPLPPPPASMVWSPFPKTGSTTQSEAQRQQVAAFLNKNGENKNKENKNVLRSSSAAPSPQLINAVNKQGVWIIVVTPTTPPLHVIRAEDWRRQKNNKTTSVKYIFHPFLQKEKQKILILQTVRSIYFLSSTTDFAKDEPSRRTTAVSNHC